MLSVVGRLHILDDTAPVVIRTNDTAVAILHALLFHELGHQSHTMVTDQRSISEQVFCFFIYLLLINLSAFRFRAKTSFMGIAKSIISTNINRSFVRHTDGPCNSFILLKANLN